MAESSESEVQRLVLAVQQSAKYGRVAPELIATIGRRELRARGSLKEAIKCTKSRLHQVHGAFFTVEPRYDEWLDDLAAAAAGKPDVLRAACLRVMRHHASTRERAALLDRFYAELLRDLPPVRSLLDLGCGLNPLAIPWMGLAPDATYQCCDIDTGLVEFLNRFFAHTGIRGQATVCDITRDPPRHAADLVLALKLLPSLDAIERGAGLSVLRAIHAPSMLVSFSAQSLCGRRKGMSEYHEAAFTALAQREGWHIRKHPLPGELCFLVSRDAP